MKEFKNTAKTLLIRNIAMDLLFLIVAFSFSLHFRRFVNFLPTQDYGIKSNSGMYSEGNYIALIGIVILTLGIYFILKRLESTKRSLFRALMILFATLTMFLSVIAPSVGGIQNNVDTFHHGEQLSPAIAFENDKKPYQDIFFLRGVGEDVIAPWVSFKLFGQSMGSYYFFTGILKLAAIIIFFYLLSQLFKSNLQFLLVLLWFTISPYGHIYSSRDIFTWLGLILALKLIFNRSGNARILFSLGLLTSLSIFYAFDRGIYLHLLTIIICLLTFFFKKDGLSYSFYHRHSVQHKVKEIIPLLAGYLLGMSTVLILLGFNGFGAFIKTTLVAIKYQGVIFNYPYPMLEKSSLFSWIPILILIAVSLAIFWTIKQAPKKLSNETVLEIVLLIFSIAFLRSATGRPDSGHVAYATVVLFVLFFVVAFRRIEQISIASSKATSMLLEKNWPLFLLLGLIVSPQVINYYALPSAHQKSLKDTKIFLKSSTKPDEFWLTEKVKITTDYIKSTTDNDDYLFVLSSDAVFYYTTGLKNPTRFYISWFADPDVLEIEMLNDLKKHPPKVVIYETGLWDGPDGFYMKERLPLVNEWILEKYKKETTIENVKLLTEY